MVGKIDVHTHALPDFFHKSLLEVGREASGVPIIEWSLDATKRMNTKLGITTSILSLSAPGPDILPDKHAARSLARQYNEWAADLTKSDPSHFGFFAAVPSLHDTHGCITEIRHALDDLKADGICLFTTYDGKYLGEPAFEPIWQELDAHHAVVFIHPTIAKGTRPVSIMLQPPAFDFAHETGRTAAHLIITGMKRKYPDTSIILSHGGGTLPILSERLAMTEANLFSNTLGPGSPTTAAEILQDAKSFYFDLALAGTGNVLDMLLKWAPRERLLFGSDFPYATVEAEYCTRSLEEYEIEAGDREMYYVGNARRLFPRLGGQ